MAPTSWISQLRLFKLKTLAPGLRASNVRVRALTQVFQDLASPSGRPDAKRLCSSPGALQPHCHQFMKTQQHPGSALAASRPRPALALLLTRGLRQTALLEDRPSPRPGPLPSTCHSLSHFPSHPLLLTKFIQCGDRAVFTRLWGPLKHPGEPPQDRWAHWEQGGRLAWDASVKPPV